MWGVQDGEGFQITLKLLIEDGTLTIDNQMKFPVLEVVKNPYFFEKTLDQDIHPFVTGFPVPGKAMHEITGINENQLFHDGL